MWRFRLSISDEHGTSKGTSSPRPLDADEPDAESEPPHLPVAVVTILALNLLIFVLQTLSGGSTNTFNLVRFGAQHGASIENGEYWRFVTAAFLHIGILHLLVNCFCLWQLGTMLERLYGGTHFAFLYLISGVGGTFTSFFLNEFVSPRTVSAGASGAIFGVAAAMAVAGLRYADQIPENLQRSFGSGVLPFIGFNLYYGLTRGGVDNYAHIGGALAGVLSGWVFHPHREERWAAPRAAAVLVGLVLIAFGLLYRAVTAYDRDLSRAYELLNADRFPEAQELFDRLRKKGSEDPRLLTLNGVLELGEGNLREAVLSFRLAGIYSSRLLPERLALGTALVRQKHYAAAAKVFRQGTKIDPSSAAAFTGLGSALIGLNRPREAEAAYREALRLDPGHWMAHHGLATALELEEKPEEAAEAYRAAARLAPRSPEVRRGLVRVLLKLERKEEAAEELRQLLAIDPADEAARRTLADIETPRPRR